YSGGANVAAEHVAESVILDLADECRAGAETSETDRGVGGRPARNLDGSPHCTVDRFRPRLVDQRHTALVHAVANQEIVVDARDDVDDGVADAKNVEARI